MSSSSRARWAGLFAALFVLAFAPAANAAIASSQITSPASPSYGIYDAEAPNTISVSGTTSGGNPATDKVNLDCFSGSAPEDKVLAEEVSLNPDGSFSVAAANLKNIDDQVCRLRAVPTGAIPADLSPFSGPLMATGERYGSSKIQTGPNTGQPYDFYIWGQQLSAADDYASAGSCGLDDAYLFDSELHKSTTTFYCNDWLWYYENFENEAASTRSELRVDGANAYLPADADEINSEASSGFPTLTYSYSQDPLTGNLTIHESDTIVKCPEATFPATKTSCPSFLGTGVRDDRTIVQSNDGHLVTFTDQFVSTDGQAHTLDLLPQNDQYFGSSGEKIAYRFPGEGSFTTHKDGESVAFAGETPAAVFAQVQGSPDGDTSTGRGAIVFDHSASPATFNEVNSGSDFYFHQSATVPAGGSTTLRFAYAQAYTSSEVEALVQQAESSFRPPPPLPAPVVVPSNSFTFGKVKLNKRKGTARLQVKLPDAGTIVLSGKQIKTVKRGVLTAGSFSLAVTPKGKLVHKLKITGRVKVTVKVTFTPTGGSAKTETKRLKLLRR
ncbi:MAG: hypothetical protein WB507_14380 [Solirubrobacterales bacterium]